MIETKKGENNEEEDPKNKKCVCGDSSLDLNYLSMMMEE